MYSDPEYQAAHDDVFATPLNALVEDVLPPGLTQDEFTGAIQQLVEALGQDAVFTGSKLKEYVDPWEIPESGHERKIPSGAVW